MSCLLPYISHALQAPDDHNIQYSKTGASGLILMNTQGKIEFMCPEAKNLLALACHPVLTVKAPTGEAAVLQKLTQLCTNLDAIFQGKVAAPPCWSYNNGRGRFIFRAYWLNRQNNEPGHLIGMTIEHHEPVELKVLRALQPMSLSPTQNQVAVLLAQGLSNEQIGTDMHIKLTTVKDHVGKIFKKLDIHSREELLPKLFKHRLEIN
ncbi:helix-turn-helix transcriptional regulator [Crenothrix sp.]|uniref:helix-turn-helix domain-containing protein n=1 Tax=Crenothrix sp. TaxID=3100433 RepID=UPI00374CCE64